MNLNAVRIIDPGPLFTVQDSGRFGYQDRGVPVSGAMDLQALRIANFLAENRDAEAGIEITWGGFRAELLAPAHIAVTGADPKPSLNGRSFPCWSSVSARKGDILELNDVGTGCRSYVALSGGVDVPVVIGQQIHLSSRRIWRTQGKSATERGCSRSGAGGDTHFGMSPDLDSGLFRPSGAAGYFGTPGRRVDAGKPLPVFIIGFCCLGSL